MKKEAEKEKEREMERENVRIIISKKFIQYLLAKTQTIEKAFFQAT